METDGILLIDKPSGWSSFDVVAKVRSVLRTEIRKQKLRTSESQLISNSQLQIPKIKVGHTGTLDPLATGLMIVVAGSYCKRASEFSKLDKTYQVTMKLGQTSTTGDEEGEKTEVNSSKTVDRQSLEQVMLGFVGESMQTPPAFSAIKINGKRAYKLAREGKEVKIEPRKIKINSLEIADYAYPKVVFTASVGSGTYIRSLVEDIGKKLNTGAYMSDLRRTKVGIWNIEDAATVHKNTSYEDIADHLQAVEVL